MSNMLDGAREEAMREPSEFANNAAETRPGGAQQAVRGAGVHHGVRTRARRGRRRAGRGGRAASEAQALTGQRGRIGARLQQHPDNCRKRFSCQSVTFLHSARCALAAAGATCCEVKRRVALLVLRAGVGSCCEKSSDDVLVPA